MSDKGGAEGVDLKGFMAEFDKKNKLLIQEIGRTYSQLESLSWLQRRLSIKGQLPPLRGWAASPDVLLKLHTYVMEVKPRIIIEFGSGSTTMVIADALRQNGIGKLISVEHSQYYADQTIAHLNAEYLTSWVDLRVGSLEPWNDVHMNTKGKEKPSKWYPRRLLEDIDGIDLLLVDGPPAATCQFARYPAVPALLERLSDNAQIWMDDTARRDEKTVCQRWSDDYGFNLEYVPMEKGLGILKRI
ncbi:hypothetical protein EHLJMEHL_04823 [Vreelandella titanicae]